jgi:uncharacterized protein
MKRTRVTVLAALTAVGVLSPGLLGVSPASAASRTSAGPARTADPQWESVVVSGTGDVFGEPDTLTADFAVDTTAATVSEALDQAVTAANRMRDALVRAGIDRADLRTANVSIGSTQDEHGKPAGYNVNQGLTATIRDLPKAGALMSAAIKAGGDAARLNGVSFTVEKSAGLLAEARKKAFADARAKARLYARESGRPLGRVVKISEGQPGWAAPGQRDKMTAAMAAMDSSAPIEPGRQRLSVTVTVEWVLGPVPTR